MNAAPEAVEGAAPTLPTITVHSGNASAEDVAVLTVLAAALGGSGEQAQRASRTGWSSGSRRITQFAVRGSGWGRR
ncbi:MAG: hypothetical protein IPI32_03945 [Austwickia sp.]|nr:hypothetical protein [Austwickia sp.]MBK8436781.1 hypothetical protein [Austwickia sp.]MBK9100410.1 hypothetical protein [Austwickia sp.]